MPRHTYTQTQHFPSKHTHTTTLQERRAHIMSAWFICHKSKQARAHARCLCAARVWERVRERALREQTWRKGWVICLAAALLFICALSPSLCLAHSLTHSLTCSRSFLLRSFALSALAVCVCVRACAYLCVQQWWCVWVSERTLSFSLSLWLILMAEVKCLSLAHNIRKWHFLCRRRPSPPPFSLKLNTLSLAHKHTERHRQCRILVLSLFLFDCFPVAAIVAFVVVVVVALSSWLFLAAVEKPRHNWQRVFASFLRHPPLARSWTLLLLAPSSHKSWQKELF